MKWIIVSRLSLLFESRSLETSTSSLANKLAPACRQARRPAGWFADYGIRTALVLLVLTAFLFTSCQKEEDLNVDNLYIAPELQPYFDLFEEEAAARGYDYDLDEENLEGYLLRITEDDVVGQCNYNSDRPNRVTIDLGFWRRASSFDREMVVFHELGHCVLGLGHTDDANPDGTCVSIMHSGLGDCELDYNDVNRTTYLDELFSQ